MTVNQILLIVALILFILAAVGVPSSRINLVAAGLAFWLLAQLIGPLTLK